MKTSIFAILLLVPTMIAAAPGDEAITGDLARLQGSWVTSAGPKNDISVALEIKGTCVTVEIKTPIGVKIHAEGELKIDDKVSPKSIDWIRFTALEGQEMPEVLAIYELSGDTLRLANGGPNNPRPSQFKAGEGILAEVVTLTRPKNEVGKAKTAMALSDARR